MRHVAIRSPRRTSPKQPAPMPSEGGLPERGLAEAFFKNYYYTEKTVMDRWWWDVVNWTIIRPARITFPTPPGTGALIIYLFIFIGACVANNKEIWLRSDWITRSVASRLWDMSQENLLGLGDSVCSFTLKKKCKASGSVCIARV